MRVFCAAQCVDVDRLHAVEVHGDVANVARQPRPDAIGRNLDPLADIRAVEQQGIDSGLAVDDVAAVARVPDIGIVARAERAVPAPRLPMTRSSRALPTIRSLPSPPLIVSLI